MHAILRAALGTTLLAIAAALPAQAGARGAADAAAAAQAPAAFEAWLRQCRDAFEARPLSEVVYAPARDAWVKRVHAPARIQAQVRPTPSVVTPYVAQITVVELASAQPGPDFDTTRLMDVPMDRNLLRSERRMHFAFQEGQWTLLGMAVLLEVKVDATMDFETVRAARLEPRAARRLEGPIAACTSPQHG